MGFFKELGNVCIESAKSGVANGVLSSLGGIGTLSPSESPFDILNNIDSLLRNSDDVDFSGVSLDKYNINSIEKRTQKELDNLHPGLNNDINKNKVNFINNDDIFVDDFENLIKLKIPNWGYKNYINERFLFKKNITSFFGEPGSYQFRIFFEFNTQNGLFGGLLNNQSYVNSNNSAAKYLKICSHRYIQEKLIDRLDALHKFASILSFINGNAPWFFIGIKGLDKAGIPTISDFTKEHSISIECNEDSVDMRLNTLLDLYKYACYDEINSKEIIPENLRKFNMKILVFQTPLRSLHTKSQYNTNQSITYKTNTSADDLMTFKMFEFYNCEFDITSLGSLIPGTLKNDKPFKLGTSDIKINYDKVCQFTSNEYYQMTFGSTGFYYNNYSMLQDFTHDLNSPYILRLKNYEKNKFQYIDDISILEKLGTNFLMKLIKSSKKSGARLGSIYDPIDKGLGTKYFEDKIKALKNGKKINKTNIYNTRNTSDRNVINNNDKSNKENIYNNININEIISNKFKNFYKEPSKKSIYENDRE